MRGSGSWVAGALLAALPVGACGQAMVEYTLGVGRAVAGAPAAKKAGEAAAAAFEKLGKTLEKGGQAAATASQIALPPVPKRLGPFADPAIITAGLTRAELLNRFGDPVMKTAGGQSAEAGETYYYSTRQGDSVVVTVREGKVTAVTSEPKRQHQSAAVVIVQ